MPQLLPCHLPATTPLRTQSLALGQGLGREQMPPPRTHTLYPPPSATSIVCQFQGKRFGAGILMDTDRRGGVEGGFIPTNGAKAPFRPRPCCS